MRKGNKPKTNKKEIILLFAAAIVLFCFAVFPLKTESKQIHFEMLEEYKDKEISVLMKESGNKEKMPLEEYVLSVVAAEMPASYEEEALKAQAVCARNLSDV